MGKPNIFSQATKPKPVAGATSTNKVPVVRGHVAGKNEIIGISGKVSPAKSFKAVVVPGDAVQGVVQRAVKMTPGKGNVKVVSKVVVSKGTVVGLRQKLAGQLMGHVVGLGPVGQLVSVFVAGATDYPVRPEIKTQQFLAIVDEVDERDVRVEALAEESDDRVRFVLDTVAVDEQLESRIKEGDCISLFVIKEDDQLADFKIELLKDDHLIDRVTKALGPQKPLSSYADDII